MTNMRINNVRSTIDDPRKKYKEAVFFPHEDCEVSEFDIEIAASQTKLVYYLINLIQVQSSKYSENLFIE